MQPVTLMSPRRRDMRGDRRGVAAMEFAMIAPVMLLMMWGVYDISRALLAWEETIRAAQAVGQAAEKLSLKGVDPNTGKPTTALTSVDMQTAMTSIYAEMPWLNLGSGGAFSGPNTSYSVTLSGVAYLPTCNAAAYKTNPGACNYVGPSVLWSSYLTEGGSQLQQPPQHGFDPLIRQCPPVAGVASLIPWPQFPNNNKQLAYMIDPNLITVPNAPASTNLPPQVVADVQYTFVPTFPLFPYASITFYASATFPAPEGDEDQEIVFDQRDSPQANTVANCPGGNPLVQ